MKILKKTLIILLFFYLNIFCNFNTTPSYVVLKLYQVMKDVHEVLDKHNIPYWIHAGTLLGAVRHKGIIPWDDDVDIVIEKQYEGNLLKTKDTFESLGYIFKKVNYGYNILFPQTNNHYINLDIMLFSKQNNKYVYDTKHIGPYHKSIFFDEKDLFPLKKYEFGQLMIMGPQNPVPYLNLAYPDWQTHAHMSNHFYFGGPITPLLEEYLIPAQPTGPLNDNIKKKFTLNALIIREANLNDNYILSKFLDQLGFPTDSKEMVLQKIEIFSKSEFDKVWVASIEDNIIGFLAINIINPFYKPKYFGRIDSIVVDQAYQRNKIGNALIQKAEEYAKKIGCSRIFLTSGNHRPSAHAFYKKLGYISNATYFTKEL